MSFKPRLLLSVLIFLLSFKLSAQKNIHQFSSEENNFITTVINDNNSVFIGGSFEDSAFFNSYTLKSLTTSSKTVSGKSGDVFIANLDTSATLKWAKIIGGHDYTNLKGLVKDPAGNLSVTVEFQDFFTTDSDTFYGLNGKNCGIVKLNNKGEKIWAKAIRSNKRIEHRYLTTDENNNTYITANCNDTIYIDGKAYYENFISSAFIKFDAQGNVKWVKIFSNNEKGEFIVATCVSVLPSGEIILIGNSSKKAGNFEGKQLLAEDSTFRFFVMKLKENNTILWINTATGSSGAGAGRYMDVSEHGDIYVTGLIYGNMTIENTTRQGFDKAPYSDLFFGKYTKEGKLAWMKVFGSGTGNADMVYGLKYRENGKLYLSAGYIQAYNLGDTILNPMGKADGYIAEFDTNTNLTKLITTKGENALCVSTFQDFDIDSKGNLYLVGTLNFIVNLKDIKLTTAGATDGFLWKINNWTDPAGINENQPFLSDFTFKISPNPSSGFINIDFALNKPENIKFELTDLTGRTFLLKPQATYQAGSYTEKFLFNGLTSGCYFIKAITREKVECRKLIINAK